MTREAHAPDSSYDGAGSSAVIQVSIDVTGLADAVAAAVVRRLHELSGGDRSDWLDVDGAARHLGCSPHRVRKLARERGLPFHQDRPGGRIFFNRREIDQWMHAT